MGGWRGRRERRQRPVAGVGIRRVIEVRLDHTGGRKGSNGPTRGGAAVVGRRVLRLEEDGRVGRSRSWRGILGRFVLLNGVCHHVQSCRQRPGLGGAQLHPGEDSDEF